MKKPSFAYNAKQFVTIFLASLATAVSLELFLLPENVVIGGVLGVASILDVLLATNGQWYFSVAVWLVLINVPIVIYCYVTFERRFANKTLYYLCLLATELIVLRLTNVGELFHNLMYPEGGTHDKVIQLLIGGALQGISLPLMLSVGASTGGSDIVGIMIQRRTKRSSSEAMRLILLINVAIITVSAAVYYLITKNSEQAINLFIFSVVALFISQIVQERMFKGFSSAMELEITTDKPEEMAQALHKQLNHGTSTIKVVGGYSKQEKHLVLCVVNKSQLIAARRVIHKVDPNAFFVLWCRATVGGALLYVLFATANFQSATAHQQCHHQNQAGWVDVEVEVSNFAPTATQKQHHKQNPSAVATTKATAVVCAATIVKQTVEKACVMLNEMRKVEGEKLVLDMLSRINTITCLADKISERAPLVALEYKERLKTRIEEFLKDVKYDEARLLNEVAFYTDKVNIDEELTRLSSHVAQFREIVKKAGSGKKLDFLMQEFNRETNTICSKSNDIEVTKYALELKNEIEKVREQVQNLE